MKKIYKVNDSQGVISLFLGLKSRISRTKPALTMLALLMVCLFGVNESAWGYYKSNVYVNSSPSTGGYVYVGTNNSCNASSCGEKKTDDASKQGGKLLQTSGNNTFYLCNNPKSSEGYVFKGWKKKNNSDSAENYNTGDGVNDNPYSVTVSGSASSGGGTNHYYYAIFARLTAQSTAALAFGTKLVGAKWSDGTTKSVTIDYVHAGDITATISGTNSTEFSLSSSSSLQNNTVVSGNTNSETNSTITVYFKPTTTGSKSAKLTISSNNNLTSIVINLSGTGQATVPPTDTCKLADSYYVGATALDLNKLWTSNSPATKRYKVESFTATGINNDNAIAPSITGTSLSLGQAGDLTISMAQSATTGYYKDSTVKVIHILKHEPTFEWNKNNTAYYHNTSIANIFSTNNKDCNYTITSSDALVATVSNNTLYILSKTSPSKATFTVTQDENYYWKGKTSYYDVTPTNPSNHLTMNYSQALYNEGSITSKTGTTQWEKDYVIIGNAIGGGFNWDDKYIIIHFLGIPDKMSFKFKTTTHDATGVNWYVDESSDGTNWTRRPWSNNARDDDEWSDKQEFSLDKNSRYVKICYSGNFAGCFQNIKITELKKFEPSVEALDFETQQIKVACPNKTFDLNYANIGHNVTLSVNDDAFTVSPTTITSIGGEKSGTYTPITVSYSTENLHKTAAGAKITIQDELGNEKYVYLSGETKKKKQTLNWISKYNVDQPSVPVNKEITGAATCSPLTDVRYSSSDPTVIEILDEGRSFRALIADSAATITARQAGSAEWDTISISKRFKTTNKTVQVILWNQNLTNFTTENTSSGLQAKVYLEDPKTGTLTYSAERTLLLTYTPGSESVVTVDGTTLLIHGKGTTTLTASVDGNDDYEGTSAVLPVAVNEPIAGCPDENLPISIIGDDMVQDGEIILFNMSTDKPTLSKTISINTDKGVPGELHFSTKGTKFAKIWFNGEVQVRESPDNVHWSGVIWHGTPSVSDTYSPKSVVLQHNTRYVQFTRPQGGEGYHHINNIYVTPAQFIETNLPKDKLKKDSLGFGTMEFTSSLEKVVEISYANAKSNLTLAVDNANKDNISLSANTIFISECGGKGTYNLTVTCTPQSATPINATITITDENAGKSTTIRVVADVIRAAQQIEWNPTQTSFYTVQTEELNAQLPKLTDKNQTVKLTSENTDIVSFSGTTASIHKDGTVTLCASHPGSPDLNKADTIKNDFTINITPTTITALPAISGTIYGGTAADDVVLTGGSTKNTVNNEGVGGSFKVISPATLDAGTYDLTIEFKPDNENMYSRSQATLENVTISQITPEASELGVTVGKITYGQSIDEASLTNTGSLAGTWHWVDEAANHATPGAGNCNNLNVYFEPTNTNYATVYSTVSVTVDKETPTLNWTSAPTELAYNATDAVYTATSASDGDITYSIISGDSYARIDANTGALTIDVPGNTITIQAEQAEGTNYSAPTTITVEVTIAAAPVGPNTFTNNAGDNDWQNAENWTNGVPSGVNPDVIISGALEIDENVTVGNLTIENTGGVTVITNGTLTVKGTSEDRSEYGDVHVLNDGAIHLGSSADLQVRHFTLDAKLAGKNILDVKEAAASGQVDSVSNLHVNGDAYFQMTFDPKGKISFGWYDFVVPFPVNISDGIYREGNLTNHLVSGVDFIVQEYSETRNANKQKAWSNFNGTMQPGRVYTIGFNYDPNFDQNVFVFKKASGAAIGGPMEFATQYTAGSGDTDDCGWNGLGNGTLQHGYITGTYAKMQVYNHAENKYDLLTGKNPSFAVGTSFFVQVGEAHPTMEWNKTEDYDANPLYAPKREAVEVEEFLLSLRGENQVDASDHLYFSGSEEATEEYVIGHDLRKMGNPTEAKTTQMWATKNGKNLCDIETRMENYSASSDINFYAPQAGTYELTVEEMPDNATLYLTQNGDIVWNLSMSPYTIDLTKGTTEGYGLRIVADRQTTTDVENSEIENQSVRKVLIDDKIYIVTPDGKMYDIVGKSVKY